MFELTDAGDEQVKKKSVRYEVKTLNPAQTLEEAMATAWKAIHECSYNKATMRARMVSSCLAMLHYLDFLETREKQALTDAQIARQDLVDNTCNRLLNELAGRGNLVQWDIGHISTVREAVQKVLVDKLHLMTKMEFYPYLGRVHKSEY